MKSDCSKYSDSIKPKMMPKTNKEIRELLECLRTDVDLYISSLAKGKDDFIRHFRESVLPLLREKGLLPSYLNQMTKYIRVLDTKTISAFHNFELAIERFWSDLKQIASIQKYTPLKGARVEHFITESAKVVYVDFSNLLMIASQMFFALEFYCRILCALGCIKVALKVARAEILQHRDWWGQLRRLSDKGHIYCETCLTLDTCKSEVDFGALARIYAYSMKNRQIADYTPKLVSFDIVKSGLIEPPLIYFQSINSLLRETTLFYDSLTEFAPAIGYGRKELVKELRNPFIWGDEDRLKEAINEKEDKGFYNYLLGRFYYEKNRFEETIKPLERARKINPKSAEIWNLLGTIYDATAKTRKDLQKALKYIKRARDLAPSDYDVLWKMGILELSLDDYPSAIKTLTRASDYATTDFDKLLPFLTLSEAYKITGKTDESRLYLQKSKRILKDVDHLIEYVRNFIRERRKAK